MRHRRAVLVVAIMTVGLVWYGSTVSDENPVPHITTQERTQKQVVSNTDASGAMQALSKLPIKGRAPKTGYARTQFGNGWTTTNGCDTRNRILQRDLVDIVLSHGCLVLRGTLHDPYTGKDIAFKRGRGTSRAVQIDHVVALGNAWVTGAQQLSREKREQLANDPLELLAVDGPANEQKSDSDAASWLPANKSFRCQYVARQLAVKVKYHLWVTSAESSAMKRTLAACPGQELPQP